jgi:hypothetical protein
MKTIKLKVVKADAKISPMTKKTCLVTELSAKNNTIINNIIKKSITFIYSILSDNQTWKH